MANRAKPFIVWRLAVKNYPSLAEFDPILYASMKAESQRQEQHIGLIASENYASPRVLMAQSSPLQNKYAEGYPGRRYYGGCEYVDQIEQLAIERAKQLFNVEYANVQPHSGSQANAAVLMALLQPGDCLLGMDLAHGGHLTHGSKVSFSGKIYQAVSYGVNEAGIIDYQHLEKLAKQHKPKLIIAGFSAYSRIIDWKKFREIADSVGAFLMADIAHVAGLIAVGLYPSPIPIADVVTLTTHKTLRGPRGGMILARDSHFAKEKKLDAMIFPGLQGGPLMHIIAAKAMAFLEALQPEFKTYQQQVIKNAQVMAQYLESHGFHIISGGTDNHLFLIDLKNQKISGKEAEQSLGQINITLNKNMIPNDPRKASATSGLRIGTPAITTRGFKETEAQQVASWISDRLHHPDDTETMIRLTREISDFCRRFPVYV